MVADTGATPRPGGIRPLDEPQLVQVDVGEGDIPTGVRLKPVLSLSNGPVLSSHAPVRRHGQMKIDCATTGGSTGSGRAGVVSARPEPVEGPPYFQSSKTERPERGSSKGRRREVLEVLDTWRIDDEWWRKQSVSRLYYRVVLEDGTMTGLFKDLISDQWYQQRV